MIEKKRYIFIEFLFFFLHFSYNYNFPAVISEGICLSPHYNAGKYSDLDQKYFICNLQYT